MSFYTKNKEGIVLVPMEKVETLLSNDVKVYSDKDLIYELGLKIEKLQEENKILREALEFYAENRNWEQRESGSVKLCTIDPVDHYQYVDKWGDVFWIGGKRASEALVKLNEKQGEG